MVDVTHTNPSPNIGQKDPDGAEIDPTTELLRGSIRDRTPAALLAIQMLLAPAVMQPSESAGARGIRA